jgi:hypothetical protein
MKTILTSIAAGILLATLAAAQPQPRYTVIADSRASGSGFPALDAPDRSSPGGGSKSQTPYPCRYVRS